MTNTAQGFIVVDFFSRAVGMMLIGVGLYRNGVITGDRTIGYYRRTPVIGLDVGLPLAAIGLAWVAASDSLLVWRLSGPSPIRWVRSRL